MPLRLATMAVVLAAVGAAPTGVGASRPPLVVDRTWSCPLHTSDGLRIVGLSGSPGFVDVPQSDASTYVTDELAPSGARSELASVGSKGLRIHRQCIAARPISLSRRGLPGPPGIFQANYDCESKPTTVLVRLRAVVASAARWKRDRPAHLVLEARVGGAVLSLRTPNRRAIGHATIAGKELRLWISPSCVRG